jgi:galactoside O-acetyltransferase
MYYSLKQLNNIGFKCLGSNIQISKLAKFINPMNITLKNNIRIDDYCFLSANSGIIDIGNYVHIARNVSLFSGSKIILSDFSGISHNCSVFGKSDIFDGTCLTGPTIPDKYKKLITGDIFLGKHVVVCSNSVILPDTYINDGAIVGAMSLVYGNLNGWNIYGGSPVKKLKERKQDCLKYEKELISNNETNN